MKWEFWTVGDNWPSKEKQMGGTGIMNPVCSRRVSVTWCLYMRMHETPGVYVTAVLVSAEPNKRSDGQLWMLYYCQTVIYRVVSRL